MKKLFFLAFSCLGIYFYLQMQMSSDIEIVEPTPEQLKQMYGLSGAKVTPLPPLQ
ncbi:hypothetical protein MED121_07996 [Marinomonas sp. MED121]|nr:hypothetical protein MED121_07996 [Marinomonas sp. MED121]